MASASTLHGTMAGAGVGTVVALAGLDFTANLVLAWACFAVAGLGCAALIALSFIPPTASQPALELRHEPGEAPDWPDMRARKALLAALTPGQRRSWERWGYFTVIGGTTGRQYEVESYHQFNIVCKRVHRKYCIAPIEPMPGDDMVLCQKLWIEGAEEVFLATANTAVV